MRNHSARARTTGQYRAVAVQGNDDDAADADAARLGTMLNVRADMWPADRVAFEEYWAEQTNDLTIDPPVRDTLVSLADLSFLPGPLGLFGTALHRLFGPGQLFMTKGALPEPFRRAMGFEWTDDDDRRHRTAIVRYRRIDRVTPGLLKGYNEFMLAGLRIRRRFGIEVF